MLENNSLLKEPGAPVPQAALPHAVKPPTALSPSAYHSFAFALREDAAIWTLDWVCIGTHADIPETGDLLPFTVGDHAVHVQRDATGSLLGRFNQAQHGGCRAVPLQCQQGAKTPCSFTSCGHSLDRMPLRASEVGGTTPEMYQYLGLRPERLLPVRTASLGPLLFVNLNPLGAAFGQMSRELAATLPLLADRSWVRTEHSWLEYGGNWKLVGQSLTAAAGSEVRLAKGVASIRGKSNAGGWHSLAPVTAMWGFPNLLVLARPDSLCVVVLQPVAINRTRCRVSIFHAAGVKSTSDWLALLGACAGEIENTQRAMEAWGTASDAKSQSDTPPFAIKALSGWMRDMVASSFGRLSNPPLNGTSTSTCSTGITAGIRIPIRSTQ